MGELEVVLASETIPFADPAVEGAKLSARVTYWPGFNVTP
jgi:hypothetical protein